MNSPCRYTKVGYAGNPITTAVFPTAFAYRSNEGVEKVSQRKKRNDGLYKSVEDLDYLVGENAFGHNNYIPTCPIQLGIIQDWISMVKIFDYSLYQELRCNPEEHYFLITEPFNNTPVSIVIPLHSQENREYTAEVLFETFNAPGMYIATQAVLCLYASALSRNRTQPVLLLPFYSPDGLCGVGRGGGRGRGRYLDHPRGSASRSLRCSRRATCWERR